MSEHKHILEQLGSDNTEDVREAAFAAGDLLLKEAVPLLATHLESANLGVQEAAEQAIRKIGGAPAVQAVIPLLRSDEAPARNISMDILREIGADDFDSLTRLLHDDDPDMRIFASDILGSCAKVDAVRPLCEALLRDPEVNVRYQAAVSLGSLAFPEAAECLNNALQDEEWVQFSVIEALTKIRAESSVNALVRALDYSSDLVASMIVDALGEMGNIKAVSLLLRRLESSPTPLRNKIVKAVVQLMGGKLLNLLPDKEHERFREYLLVAIQDEEEDIQDAAIFGLGFMGGDKATTAVMDIAAKLNPDRDHERLVKAVDSLASIGANSALEKELHSEDEYRVQIAVEAIAGMSDPSPIIPVLMELFWSKDRDVQRALVSVLASVAAAEEIQFFLDVLAKHNDGNVLKAALTFIGKMGQADEVGDILFSMLEHPYDDVKEVALDACIALADDKMGQRFRTLFASEDPLNRLMATYALGKFDIDGNLDLLETALEDSVPDIRKVALEAVADVCSDVDRRLQMVLPRLHDENSEVRLALVELLGKCDCADVSEPLMQALHDGDDWVRMRAAEALGKRRERTALPALVEMLNDDSPLVTIKAIEALGVIGGKTAFRALLSMVDSDSPEIQEAAELAIGKIQEQGEGA
ncbi:HEAT repeat domain-containing protein [Oleidesulfovibrio sp.]|uniref:HEAT repeat domain-containing protein n=1 Tax=Oleidesulfovibrio sp. TaxID=2909707 RepID=UPI003A85AAEE